VTSGENRFWDGRSAAVLCEWGGLPLVAVRWSRRRRTRPASVVNTIGGSSFLRQSGGAVVWREGTYCGGTH